MEINSTLPLTKRNQKSVMKELDGFSLFQVYFRKIFVAIIYLFPLSGPPGNNVAVLLHNKLGVTPYCIGGGQ